MALAERLAGEMSARARGCVIGRLLDTLATDDATALQSAIDEVRAAQQRGVHPQARQGITATAIHRALSAEGVQTTAYTIQTHVYRRCGCGR